MLEGPAAEAADEERVQRPEDGGGCGRGDEPAARVAGEAAGEGHRRAAAGDEAADDDELRAEPVERSLRPRLRSLALRRAEEPALHRGPEAAAEQVAEVVAGEGARRHEADEQRDTRVGAPRGGDAERDDRRLARHQGKDRVKGRQQEGDEVRDRRINLQAV